MQTSRASIGRPPSTFQPLWVTSQSMNAPVPSGSEASIRIADTFRVP
jgi:hypothetical protein